MAPGKDGGARGYRGRHVPRPSAAGRGISMVPCCGLPGPIMDTSDATEPAKNQALHRRQASYYPASNTSMTQPPSYPASASPTCTFAWHLSAFLNAATPQCARTHHIMPHKPFGRHWHLRPGEPSRAHRATHTVRLASAHTIRAYLTTLLLRVLHPCTTTHVATRPHPTPPYNSTPHRHTYP